MRAPEQWHQNAIRAAYSNGDKEWILTAVFSMRWVRGFDDQILEALKSGDAEIQMRRNPSGRQLGNGRGLVSYPRICP